METVGIHLTGRLSGWATPKDLILHLAGKLTVRVIYLFIFTFLTKLWLIVSSREELEASWNILDLGLQANHAQVFLSVHFYSSSLSSTFQV